MVNDFVRGKAQAPLKNELYQFIKSRLSDHNATCLPGHELTFLQIIKALKLKYKLSNNNKTKKHE